MKKLAKVKVGDELTRMLGGKIPMQVIVGKIDDIHVFTSSADGIITLEEGWKFRIDTGAEVDEDLGWDGIVKTGSYIKI